MPRPIRLALRAIMLRDNRLLLVNAWPGGSPTSWCAPGGGAEPHQSLPDNLAREVREETGLESPSGRWRWSTSSTIPPRGFHQVELFFRAEITGGSLGAGEDPEGVVTRRRFFSPAELADDPAETVEPAARRLRRRRTRRPITIRWSRSCAEPADLCRSDIPRACGRRRRPAARRPDSG